MSNARAPDDQVMDLLVNDAVGSTGSIRMAPRELSADDATPRAHRTGDHHDRGGPVSGKGKNSRSNRSCRHEFDGAVVRSYPLSTPLRIFAL